MNQQLWQQALHLHQTERYQEALNCYQKLSKNTVNIDLLFNMGLVNTRLQKWDDAEKCYQSILTLKPFHSNAKNNLALLYQKLGFLFRAEKLLRELLSDDPWNLDISNNLAGILLGQGRPEQACNILYPALKRSPIYPVGWDTLGACLQDMGDIEASLASFHRSHQQDPRNAETLFHLHGLLHDLNSPEFALETLQRARRAAPERWDIQFYEHCLRSWYQLGATTLPKTQTHQAWVDTWAYMQEHRTPATKLFYTVAQTLRDSVEQSSVSGLVLEFGVRFGTTVKLLEQYSKQTVHGFDSFQGLPTSWHDVPQGAYSTNGIIPDLGKDIYLHPGWFAESIPLFTQEDQEHQKPLRLLHIDCDLYSSTKDILENIRTQIVPRTIIVFDEYIMNPKWQEDEFKAWQEFHGKYSLSYRYLSFSPMSNQTVLEIIADYPS